MRISEIFYSIQGEGILTGVPSVFVRTTGCNLRCTWCDTPYTSWNPEGSEIDLDSIESEVRKHPAKHVVVTGGEPMIAPDVVALSQRLTGLHMTVETAGTVFQPVKCDLMSISPKLSNSTPYDRDPRWAERHEQARYRPEILRQLMESYDYQLKFVVESPADLKEIQQMVKDTNADTTRVLLMPEGRTPEALRGRTKWLVETCKEFGYRFCPRLHVEIWGDRRGV